MRKLVVAFMAASLLGMGCKPRSEKPAEAKASPPTPSEPPKPVDIPAPPDVASVPADAERSASGLAWKVLQKGTGSVKPRPWDRVKIYHSAWTADGKLFDSSVQRGKPVESSVKGFVKGLTEGLKLMAVGEKRRLWIPGALAYGDEPGRDGSSSGALVFDVELLDVMPGRDPPKAPDDVAAPPKDATQTASGLAFKVLRKGTGKVKPKPWDTVRLKYTAWTPDGDMFLSSRDPPSDVRPESLIKGWGEGVRQMVVGEKRRLWIPGKLAYGEKPSPGPRPHGLVVFDVELLDLTPGRPSKSPTQPATARKSP
jgi:peptidylprolyl isomerase